MSKSDKPIVLFENKEMCCGCGVCMSVCSNKAICLIEDEYGFVYPEINAEGCVQCGLCIRVCPYKNKLDVNYPQKCYIAYHKQESIIMKSASGGAFAALASAVLGEGGVVFGAAYVEENENLSVQHIGIDSIDELYRLQGSKYVQSRTDKVFSEVKERLKQGKMVLFSGTPCQVAALKQVVDKQQENLITVDLVCHGVPSQKLFHIYLSYLENKFNGKIKQFNFRDKRKGWENYTMNMLIRKNVRNFEKSIHCRNSAFYEHFLHADIHRENCYSCPYAQEKRISDITIGDYWGIRTSHPDITKLDNWNNLERNGISCVLVNTEIGMKLLKNINNLSMIHSTIEKIANENGQLRHPNERPKNRESILKSYLQSYERVEYSYKKSVGKKWYFFKLKNLIPKGMKRNIKRLLKQK